MNEALTPTGRFHAEHRRLHGIHGVSRNGASLPSFTFSSLFGNRCLESILQGKKNLANVIICFNVILNVMNIFELPSQQYIFPSTI